MNYLTQSSQSKARFTLLLQLTKIDSENVISALNDYLVAGLNMATAATINNITQANLKRGLIALEKQAAIVEQIKELDWDLFKENGNTTCNQD